MRPGVSGSILEGLDEILTVIRLGLPHELRRSLACTNIVENALGTVRQVSRNVKRWRNAEMALRWTAAGLLEAQKTFRRLKAYRQLPILRNALQEHLRKAQCLARKELSDFVSCDSLFVSKHSGRHNMWTEITRPK